MKKYRIRKYSLLWFLRRLSPAMLSIILIATATTTLSSNHSLPAPEPQWEQAPSLNTLYESTAKTYMCYTKITDETSTQYDYIHRSGEITIDERGYLRDEEGYYGVALGSYFGEIGSKYIFTLDTGIELPVVKVEEKSDAHTIDGYIHKEDGSVIEFVVDTSTAYMQENTHENGLIYSGNFNNCPEFYGKIVAIKNISQNEKK